MSLIPQKIKPIRAYPILTTLPNQPYTVNAEESLQRRFSIGEIADETLNQGNPVSKESQLFRDEYFPRKDGIFTEHIVAGFSSYDTSMGTAKRSDPTACVDGCLMGDGTILIVDCLEERMDPGLQEKVVAERYFHMRNTFKKPWMVLIEKASSGEPLAARLRTVYGANMPLELHPATKDKGLRGAAIQGTVLNRTVHLYDKMPLLGKLVIDLCNYPLDAKNDHLPDAFCQLVSHIRGLHVPVANIQHALPRGQAEFEQYAHTIIGEAWENYDE
jgi:hypothetical protein